MSQESSSAKGRTGSSVQPSDHPAVRAWNRLTGDREPPDEIVDLKTTRVGSVYRLIGIGSESRSVIAKRARRAKARIERNVYESVLAGLSLPSIGYHGSIDEDTAPFTWLFLEDVGDERYSPTLAEDRRIAAAWLAELQVAVASRDVSDHLSDRGPGFYRRHLRSIAAQVPNLQARPSISAEACAILDDIGELVEYLEARWASLTEFCAPIPRTLVHADCLPKNVHVQRADDRSRVLFFDWAGAGCGLAATDLGLLALPHAGPSSAAPDYASYLDVATQKWPTLGIGTIEQLAHIGELFWALKVIDKSIPDFGHPFPTVTSNFRLYRDALARSLHSATWARTGSGASSAIGRSDGP